MSCQVIAEIGVNHNGSLETALELIQVAEECGADVVKFQTFQVGQLVTPRAPKAGYQIHTTKPDQSQWEMLQELELDQSDFAILQARSVELGIQFLSTPFDGQSLDFLVDELQLGTIKIGSGDLTNLPLLVEAGRAGVDLVLSTGMATMSSVYEGIGAFAFGLLFPRQQPESSAFLGNFARREETLRAVHDRLILLQCTSEYPAPLGNLNLRAMSEMQTETGLRVGFSDHSLGMLASCAAVSLGAVVIEKHLTLDRDQPGPDHLASLDPSQFRDLVDGVRSVELALGQGIKAPTTGELQNRQIATKGLYAARNLSVGETIDASAIALLRPPAKMLARDYWDVLGTQADRPYLQGEPLL